MVMFWLAYLDHHSPLEEIWCLRVSFQHGIGLTAFPEARVPDNGHALFHWLWNAISGKKHCSYIMIKKVILLFLITHFVLFLLNIFRYKNVMLLFTLKRKCEWNVLVKVPLKYFHMLCPTLLNCSTWSVLVCVCFHTSASLPVRVLVLHHFLKECVSRPPSRLVTLILQVLMQCADKRNAS